jgi:hypothetical protein
MSCEPSGAALRSRHLAARRLGVCGALVAALWLGSCRGRSPDGAVRGVPVDGGQAASEPNALAETEPAARSTKEPPMNLPRTAGIWTRPDSPRRIDSSTIFDYMDGGGELYLAYGFDHLDVYEYAAPDQDPILVELYWMNSSDDGFGLLSGDWGGEPVVLGEAPPKQGGTGPAPPHRALYGAGLLRIWSGSLYARVLAGRETPQSREQVLALGRSIVAGRDDPAGPELVTALPAAVEPARRLRPDRICYFHSHLVLNSVYFLSSQDILALGASTEAVIAAYAPATASASRARKAPAAPGAGGKSVQLLLLRYGSSEAAGRALSRFRSAYLPEMSGGSKQPSSSSAGAARIEDGWVGYHAAGRNVALVFECPDAALAQSFVERAVENMRRLERPHE